MHTARDPVSLTRDDHTGPAHPVILRPAPATDLTPQQLALLAALIQQSSQTPPSHSHPAPPAPDSTQMSGRAKSTALVMAGGGAGIGAATAGVGYGSGLIASASGGLMTAALALAIASGSLGAAALALRTAFRSKKTTPDNDAQPTTHITQHIHAAGMFGRANGTINHR